jgi:transcriptional regulator with XRE-family HTH domain
MQDLERLNKLIDQAAAKAGSDNKLAEMLGKDRQLVSNWRHGHKSPSVEVQAELASIAEVAAPLTVLDSLIEAANEPRRTRLVRARERWMRQVAEMAAQQATYVSRKPQPSDEFKRNPAATIGGNS